MSQNPAHKRRLRNYMLDKRFQLKYTSIAVGATVILSAVLGFFLHREIVASQDTILARDMGADIHVLRPTPDAGFYDFLDDLTDEYNEAIQDNVNLVVKVNNAPGDETADFYQNQFEDERAQKTTVLILALCVFLFALAVIWVYLTHRIAGPVYKLKLLFGKVRGDKMQVVGRLRKGDELQDAFIAFRDMIERLRVDRREKAAKIEEILERLGEDGSISDDDLETLKTVHEEMVESLGD